MAIDNQSRHFAFIVNPNAGRGRWPSIEPKVIRAISGGQTGHTYEIIQTTGKGHARQLAADLSARYGSRLIAFACGGDGTANEIANCITGTESAMGILPIGTANDFSKSALKQSNLDLLINSLADPDVRPIDVIRVDGQICLNIASMGFDTKVQRCASSLTDRFRWLGSFSYTLAIVLSLFGNRENTMHYRILTIDDQGGTGTVEGDAHFILAALCNGHYYGGGFNPAPEARLDDGRLDLCLVDNLPLRRILPLIPRYKQGRHLGDPAIHSWQTTEGHFEAPEGKLLLGNCDGESFEKKTIDYQILPMALRFAFY